MAALFEGKVRGTDVTIERQNKRATVTANWRDWFIDFFDKGPEIGKCEKCKKSIYAGEDYWHTNTGKMHLLCFKGEGTLNRQ